MFKGQFLNPDQKMDSRLLILNTHNYYVKQCSDLNLNVFDDGALLK
jgi:hypothetical protein